MPAATARLGLLLLLIVLVARAAAEVSSGELYSSSSSPRADAVQLPLADVRLLPGSRQANATALNAAYLRSLDVDRLLYSFRATAGLDTRAAAAYPGWEAPDCLLRGHFVGHYLSALALTSASGADAPEEWAAARAVAMVDELAACQDAIGTGYLSAFPTDHFDRLEAGETPVWAPYYTIHKILAGLLDCATRLGTRGALGAAVRLADYFAGRVEGVITSRGWAAWQAVLAVEFGGMAEVLYDLAAVTGESRHAALARRFYKQAFMDPLAGGHDTLAGLHANTHIPQVIGGARGYALEGNATLLAIAQRFAGLLAERYSYATGGNNVNEYWLFPSQLGAALETEFDAASGEPLDSPGFHTQESCTTYNTLKLLRELFAWEPSARLADAYERLMVNGLLGTQLPGEPGRMTYMTPLGAGTSRRRANFAEGWGEPEGSFWCCYGTGIESFAKLADSIYFQSAPGEGVPGVPPALWVLQYVPSEVRWAAGGLALRQTGGVARRPGSSVVYQQSVRMEVTAGPGTASPPRATLHVRVPGWAQPGSSLTLNGKPLAMAQPGTFLAITRAWAPGDVAAADFVMAGRVERLNDARPEWATVGAVLYGPLLLAGLVEGGDFSLGADMDNVGAWLQPHPESSAQRLRFWAAAATRRLELIPLNEALTQSYTVYINFTRSAASEARRLPPHPSEAASTHTRGTATA
mmetsp:Transcript_16331/g.41803  ORF Transcript_16331/g.41803 Transcript_16331/m.41803 type:complete len:696 (-) Transcript_16331:87-2174(-)